MEGLQLQSRGTARKGRGASMMQFDTFQKFGKESMDAAMTSFGAFSRGIQSAAVVG